MVITEARPRARVRIASNIGAGVAAQAAQSGFEGVVHRVFVGRVSTRHGCTVGRVSTRLVTHPKAMAGQDPPYADRVAIAGGTFAARRAGHSTAICPSAHSSTAPTGRYTSGRRGSSYRLISSWLMA